MSQLSFVWKTKDLKSKVRRINLNQLCSINWNKFWTSYLAFGVGDISPHRFTFGRAFHCLPKPPFSWFAWVTAQAQAIAHASYQGLICRNKVTFTDAVISKYIWVLMLDNGLYYHDCCYGKNNCFLSSDIIRNSQTLNEIPALSTQTPNSWLYLRFLGTS